MAAIRVLFVDDEEAFRTVVHQQLTKEGFEVETAEDGDVALDLIRARPYDIVLLDMRMGRMDGTEVLRTMKAEHRTPHVIMLTGVSELGPAIECLKLGADDYLTKPYSTAHLIACMQRVLSGKRNAKTH